MRTGSILAVVLALIVQACASNRSLDRSYAGSGQGNTGIVTLSATMTGLGRNTIGTALKFRGIDNKIIGEVKNADTFYTDLATGDVILPKLPNHFYSMEKPIGVFKALELPAGRYEFHEYFGRVSYPGYMITTTTTISPKAPFSVPFAVKPGKVVYIGNFNFHFSEGNRYSFVVTDQSMRDIPLLKSRIPELGSKNIEVTVSGLSYK